MKICKKRPQSRFRVLLQIAITFQIVSKFQILGAGATIEPGLPGAPVFIMTPPSPLFNLILKEPDGTSHYYLHSSTEVIKIEGDLSYELSSATNGDILFISCPSKKCLTASSDGRIDLHDMESGTITHSLVPTQGPPPPLVTAILMKTIPKFYAYGDSAGGFYLMSEQESGFNAFFETNFPSKSVSSILKANRYNDLILGFHGGGITKLLNLDNPGEVQDLTHSTLGDPIYSQYYRPGDQELRIYAFIYPNVIDIFSKVENSLVKTVTYPSGTEWRFVSKMRETSYTSVLTTNDQILVVDFEGGKLDQLDLSQFPGVSSIAFNFDYTEFAFTQSASNKVRIKPWNQQGHEDAGCSYKKIVKNDQGLSYFRCMECDAGWFLHGSGLCFNSDELSCDYGEYFSIEDDGSSSGCSACPSCCRGCSSLDYSPNGISCTSVEAAWWFVEPEQRCEELITSFTEPVLLSNGRRGCQVAFGIDTTLLSVQNIVVEDQSRYLDVTTNVTSQVIPSLNWSIDPESRNPEALMEFEFDSSLGGLQITFSFTKYGFQFGHDGDDSPRVIADSPQETPLSISCPKSPPQGKYELQMFDDSNLIKLKFSSEITNVTLSLFNMSVTDHKTKTPFDIQFSISGPQEITIIFENPEPAFEEYAEIRAEIYGLKEYFEIAETNIEVEREYDFPFLQSHEKEIKLTSSIVSESGIILSGFFPLLSEFFYSFNMIKIITLVPLQIPERLKLLISIFIDLDYGNITSKALDTQEPDKTFTPRNSIFAFKSSYFFRRLFQSLARLVLTFLFLFSKEYLSKKKILKFFVEKLLISHLCAIYFDFVINFLYIYCSFLTEFLLADLILILLDLIIIAFNHYLIIKVFIDYKKKRKKLVKKNFREEKIIGFYYKNFSQVFGPFPLRMFEAYIGLGELTAIVMIRDSQIVFLVIASLILPGIKVIFFARFRRIFGNVVLVERVITELAKSTLFVLFYIGELDGKFRESSLNLAISVLLMSVMLFLKFGSSVVLFFQLSRKGSRMKWAKNSIKDLDKIEEDQAGVIQSSHRRFVRGIQAQDSVSRVVPIRKNMRKSLQRSLKLRQDRRIISKRKSIAPSDSVKAVQLSQKGQKKCKLRVGSTIKSQIKDKHRRLSCIQACVGAIEKIDG